MRKLALLPLLALVVSCSDDAFAPSDFLVPGPPGRMIEDALHNGGNPFFFWLSPMVSQPDADAFGTFDPSADPTVRIICEAASSPENCPSGIGSLVTEFDLGSGVTAADQHYQLNFDTRATYNGYDLFPSEPDGGSSRDFTTYQIQVWIEKDGTPALVGLASFELGSTGGDARNLSTNEVIGLKDGRVLPIKFRIELNAHEYAVAATDPATDPCPDGCSTTRISPEEGGDAYYVSDSGATVTGVRFSPGDLAARSDGQDYTILIGPLEEGSLSPSGQGETDVCAYDVLANKYDCFRYTIFPGVEQFQNPVPFGICQQTVPTGEHERLVKVDRVDGQARVSYPDPVEVTHFLPCDASSTQPPSDGATSFLDKVFRFALDRVAPPLYAQTAIRTWGGMANDFSDLFWTVEEGLVSHWTADQLLDAYADAMLFTETLNNGTPNATARIAPDSGVAGDAFGFAAGGVITALGTGIDTASALSLSAWVRIDADAPHNVVQRFVTLGGQKAGIRMDGEAAPGQLDFYASFTGAAEPVHVRSPGPLAQGCYQHVVGTYDGSMLRLYLNGAEVAQTQHSGTLVTGDGVELSSADETLRGLLDEVRIHDKALTPGEVTHLFGAGAPGSCPPPPDLEVTSMTHDPADPTVAQAMAFTATVTNTGSGSAPESTLMFKLGGETAGTAHTLFSVPPLAAGESYTATRTWEAPVTAQSYLNTAIADYGGAVLEGSEANDATHSFLVTTPSGVLVDATQDGPSDIDQAAVTVSGTDLVLDLTFHAGFDPATSRVTWSLDTDQNAATGYPGITGAPDTDPVIGVEHLVQLSGSSFGSDVRVVTNVYDPATQSWSGTVAPTTAISPTVLRDATGSPIGYRVAIPLALLGGDDGRLDFKASVSTQLGQGSFTSRLDDVSDQGMAPGTTSGQ